MPCYLGNGKDGASSAVHLDSGMLVQHHVIKSHGVYLIGAPEIRTAGSASLRNCTNFYRSLEGGVWECGAGYLMVYFTTVFFAVIGNCGHQYLSLPRLLRFTTGGSRVPVTGLKHPIELMYQPDTPEAKLPKAQACFSKLLLPVCHSSKEDFFCSMSKALELCGAYGNS